MLSLSKINIKKFFFNFASLENQKCMVRLLCMWMSNWSSTVFVENIFFFSIQLPLCQRLVDYIGMSLSEFPILYHWFVCLSSYQYNVVDFSSFIVTLSEVGFNPTKKWEKEWLFSYKIRWSSVQMWLWISPLFSYSDMIVNIRKFYSRHVLILGMYFFYKL